MTDPIKDVFDFHEKFNLVPGEKGILSEPLARFRYNFLMEEIVEWRKAHEERWLAGCLDAMIDEIYVAVGTLVMHGFSEKEVKEAWNRVHEANMKKERVQKEGQSKRDSIFDVVKPAGWVKPELDDLCH
jgi:predicted HAD superfamily Cof-like phosphohydrolase